MFSESITTPEPHSPLDSAADFSLCKGRRVYQNASPLQTFFEFLSLSKSCLTKKDNETWKFRFLFLEKHAQQRFFTATANANSHKLNGLEPWPKNWAGPQINMIILVTLAVKTGITSLDSLMKGLTQIVKGRKAGTRPSHPDGSGEPLDPPFWFGRTARWGPARRKPIVSKTYPSDPGSAAFAG
jgi:hypothetical protein